MNFSALFAPKAPAQAPAAAPAQQQQATNNNQPQGPGTTPNTPNNPNGQNAQSTETVNPLDAYSKMFDNQNTNSEAAPSFTIDPKIMDEVVGTQDFAKGINPELMQKLTSGDFSVMPDILNHVGRNAYRSAIEHGGMLTDKFVGAREQFSSKGFSEKVRSELTTAELSSNSALQHPVARQQLKDIATRLQKAHPDVPAKEIAQMATKFFTDMASVINPQTPSKEQKEADAAPNWDSFFDGPQS